MGVSPWSKRAQPPASGVSPTDTRLYAGPRIALPGEEIVSDSF
jgi:hypothetical protein